MKVGQLVELNDGRKAVVRYAGQLHFTTGDWIGVEFDDATGKNDGSAKGVRYFQCDADHGMFLKPTMILRVIQPPKQVAKAPVKASGSQKARLSIIGTSSGRLPSPVKSPTKVKLGTGMSVESTVMPRNSATQDLSSARRATSSKAAPSLAINTTRKTSILPPPSAVSSRSSRASILSPPATGLTSRHKSTINKDDIPIASAATRHESVDSANETQNGTVISSSTGYAKPVDGSLLTSASESAELRTPTEANHQPGDRPSMLHRAASETKQFTKNLASNMKEVEDLKVKLRLLERKRLEDREKLKTLDRLQLERDKFEMIIQKLQTKYQPQQKEISDLRHRLKETEARLLELENLEAEHDTMVEMATLDREMAEENADSYKHELNGLKQKVEELELENDILRVENGELAEEMSPEERTSKGWLHMEKENERLREALLRLRDMTQEQESDLKGRLKGYEDDIAELQKTRLQYDETKASLQQAETDIDDLRQQLEATLGADEIIDELTTKNLALSERLEELQLAVEDLQSLKELNDELDINHVEHEKQLQDIIDQKESMLSEFSRRMAQQGESEANQEYTISRFRELVSALQTDLEDMRASKEITESEAQELASRTHMMAQLNSKLQSSASKSQANAINLDLREMEATEGSELLAIAQLFLPDAFNTARGSISALMRFKRVSFKASILHKNIKTFVSEPTRRYNDHNLFIAYDVLDKLTWIAAATERFIDNINNSSLDAFMKFSSALQEYEPVERTLNNALEQVKAENLNQQRLQEELQRSLAVVVHLADVLPVESPSETSIKGLMRSTIMKERLEVIATVVTLIKHIIGHVSQSTDFRIDVEESSEVQDGDGKGVENTDSFAKLGETLENADTAALQARSAKMMVLKATRAIDDFRSRALVLNRNSLSQLESICDTVDELFEFVIRLGSIVAHYLRDDVFGEFIPFSQLASAISKCARDIFNCPESVPFSLLSSKLRDLISSLGFIVDLISSFDGFVEIEKNSPPWAQYAAKVHSTIAVSSSIEAESTVLRSALTDAAAHLQHREAALDEAKVKIELLAARVRDAASKTALISELERDLKDKSESIENLSSSLTEEMRKVSSLTAERDLLKGIIEEGKATKQSANDESGRSNLPRASELETISLLSNIETLESSIKYLRNQQRHNAGQQIYSELSPYQKLLLPIDNSHLRSWLAIPIISSRMELQSDTSIPTCLATFPSPPEHLVLSPLPKPKLRLAWKPAVQMSKWKLLHSAELLEKWIHSCSSYPQPNSYSTGNGSVLVPNSGENQPIGVG